MLAQSLATIEATTTRKDCVVLWVYVDEDDWETRKAIESGTLRPPTGITTRWHIGPRTPGLGETHQAMWNASGRASEVYMISSDKARFDTAGWDEVIRAKMNEYPDGVVLGFAHDPNASDQATYPILGWGWLSTLGYFFPGYFPFWFDDKWVDEIGRMTGRYFKLPIVISPIAGRGRTQRMRGMPFWARFFQLTLDERKDAASRLIQVMHPNEGPNRAAAVAHMENIVSGLAAEEDKYSDLYATFQEERHTAMSQEERDRFDPLYANRECKAVIRLLTVAQQEIANGRHASAMKYLDAVQLSDIRMRTAQLMKAQCLRALNQPQEAARLEQDTMVLWPQMSSARRIFRFMGMLVAEAKRVIISLTEKKK
jgi:hypothetical protein